MASAITSAYPDASKTPHNSSCSDPHGHYLPASFVGIQAVTISSQPTKKDNVVPHNESPQHITSPNSNKPAAR